MGQPAFTTTTQPERSIGSNRQPGVAYRQSTNQAVPRTCRAGGSTMLGDLLASERGVAVT
jgi:hypothetical protein